MIHRQLVIAAFVLTACSGGPTEDDAGAVTTTDSGADTQVAADAGGDADAALALLDPTAPGEYAVGSRTVVLTDDARGRTLDAEIWYPAAVAGTGDVLDFEAEPNRTTYADLLDVAPDCPTTRTAANRDAALAAGGPWPVVVFSHCHACMRYSSYSVAEQLASWGYVVVAPDHEENTLFDELAGEGAEVNGEFLATRAADIRFVLDVTLDGTAMAELDGRLDAERIGAMGHSFGSVTTGVVTQEDTRIKAALGFAAPMENPLLPGVLIENIDVPLMFLVAVEDNSIREIGNRLIRDNFAKAAAKQDAWKVEVGEAGHWSFSNVAGLVELFDPGCGTGNRQNGPDDFEYLDPAVGREVAASYAVAFFETTLRGSEAGRLFLGTAPPWPDVTIESEP